MARAGFFFSTLMPKRLPRLPLAVTSTFATFTSPCGRRGRMRRKSRHTRTRSRSSANTFTWQCDVRFRHVAPRPKKSLRPQEYITLWNMRLFLTPIYLICCVFIHFSLCFLASPPGGINDLSKGSLVSLRCTKAHKFSPVFAW